ncbi:MAG: PIN domain-containing protein [Candidatus Woykebacteria bacterium]
MIFVDTSAFVALRSPADPNHKKAHEVAFQLEKREDSLITTNYILAETYTVISQKVSKDRLIAFGEEFDPRIKLISIDEDLEGAAWKIFKGIKSKNVSYCTSFAVMRYYNIDQSFAFDEDFEKFVIGS